MVNTSSQLKFIYNLRRRIGTIWLPTLAILYNTNVERMKSCLATKCRVGVGLQETQTILLLHRYSDKNENMICLLSILDDNNTCVRPTCWAFHALRIYRERNSLLVCISKWTIFPIWYIIFTTKLLSKNHGSDDSNNIPFWLIYILFGSTWSIILKFWSFL